MRILVTGANGMLGTSVNEVFTKHDLILTGSIELDVRNIKQVMSYANRKLDFILHLAAETDLLRAQFHPADAYMTNHTGTQNMVELAKLLDIPIVYIGTAGIFDGQKSKFDEDDQANPLHHYGRSKYYGEMAVKTYKKHYIVRSGWAMGGGPGIDKEFSSKIFKLIQTGTKKFYGINNVYGNPTFTLDFAKTLKNIVEAKIAYGTYNSSGKGKASRYDVLKEFVKQLGLSKKIQVIPLSHDKFNSLFPSQYPDTRSEALNTDKLDRTGLSAMRDWRVALSDYVKWFP